MCIIFTIKSRTYIDFIIIVIKKIYTPTFLIKRKLKQSRLYPVWKNFRDPCNLKKLT